MSSFSLPAFTANATQESGTSLSNAPGRYHRLNNVGPPEERTQVSTANDFLFATNIDNLNLFKIEKYIQRSEIVKKVRRHTYTEQMGNADLTSVWHTS